MSKFSKNARAIRNPLLALLATCVVGVALVVLTGKTRENSRLELQKQKSIFAEAHERYQKSDGERELIVKYLPEYRALQRQGFIGPEQRINWLDGLRNANLEAELFGVEYQVGAQEAYKDGIDIANGGANLRQSSMELNFRLLHEGDLMRFFGILANQQVGWFAINRCSLERIADIRTLQFQPYLGAKCELAWISYNENAVAKTP